MSREWDPRMGMIMMRNKVAKTNKPDTETPSANAPAPRAGKARGPGRPPASEKGGVSRQSILQAALKLSKTVPLQDLSIVVVARTINVTPALIHYYIGGRDWLTSGIMNLFYKNLLRKWPQETGDWRKDIFAAAKVFFDSLSTYPGIASYLSTNSRFRIFQLTAFGDRDYGVEVLDKMTGCVRSAGLSPARTGIYTHLVTDFVINNAHSTSHKLFPGEHRQFLEEKLTKLDPEKSPNIVYAKTAPLQLDGLVVFEEALGLFMLGIEKDLEKAGAEEESGEGNGKAK